MKKRQATIADSRLRGSRGFTLFEIFLALLILAVAIIPMMNAFAPSLLSSSQEEEQAVLSGQARSTINRVLDLDFKTLDARRGLNTDLVQLFGSQAEADKETVTYKNQSYTPQIDICATNASGVRVPDCVTDAADGTVGLLELRVSLNTVSLRTLKANR